MGDRTSETSKYISIKDGPGCALDMDVNKDNCKNAAIELGINEPEFRVIDDTEEITNAPSGCFVKKPISSFSSVYFNTMVPGETGDNRYLSICENSMQEGIDM